MTTDEIVRRLKNILRDPRWPDLCASAEDVCKDDAALTAAVQAVEALEEIKAELQGVCHACKYHELLNTQEPCRNCSTGNDLWEFRWPLGEETEHETH